MTTPETHLLSAFSNQLADAVEKAAPALVQVNGRQRQPATGVVFAPQLVLTADHVLERDSDLTIETHDGRTLAAQLVGRDPATDLAVLRVADLNIDPATAAQAPARVGQMLLLVGRPSAGGVQASLGVASAIGGPVRSRRGAMLERYIQTDATPYPGFSGGAMIDASGAVIGITTTGLASGVALGIPADLAWQVAETIGNHGQIKRGFLGVSSQPVPIPTAQRAGRTQERGLLIVQVEDNSPAQQAGLLVGDIVVSFDGQTVTDTDELQGLLGGDRVGRALPLEVIRGSTLTTVQVTLGTRA
ncbi:MAG: trypsin-like peptidase domain-containing protein [Roseiflexaceae bacterium]|nr:trypsin-like peptidase domain-containing protein [Roseiflexaceae bacterium]